MMRIVLFASGYPSWVQTDYEILARICPVDRVDTRSLNPLTLFKNIRSLLESNLCFFWFGSFRHIPYLILAQILGKKILIVAGGYDVNKLPAIHYGAFCENPISQMLRRWLFARADTILAVSEFAQRMAVENLNTSTEKVRTVYLGFNKPKVNLIPWEKRAVRVVFLISARPNMRLVKGLDRIPQLCRLLPQVQFQIIGSLTPEVLSDLQNENLPNLQCVGWVPYESERFADLLNNSRMVCLTSRTESFGAALIDGARYGCLPVASPSGAIPEILSQVGLCASSEEISDLASLIQKNINAPHFDVHLIQKNALARFSESQRASNIEAVARPLL